MALPSKCCGWLLIAVLALATPPEGHTHVLDADIKGFVDNSPHDVIMAGVADEVADGNILRLVERFLKAG